MCRRFGVLNLMASNPLKLKMCSLTTQRQYSGYLLSFQKTTNSLYGTRLFCLFLTRMVQILSSRDKGVFVLDGFDLSCRAVLTKHLPSLYENPSAANSNAPASSPRSRTKFNCNASIARFGEYVAVGKQIELLVKMAVNCS